MSQEHQLLTDTKIIDFTRLLPGPLATHLLAQMGAEVIKIEHPQRKDYARTMGIPIDGSSYLFQMLNHNKKLQIIDYQSEKGLKTIYRLLETADILIEQFRPGAMKSWGLDYASVQKINPRLVYVSLTGYGQDGPASRVAGHDLNYLAEAGLLSLLKDEFGKPIVPAFQLADIGGGSYMSVMACLAALLRANKTGKGSYVDVAMAEAILPLQTIPMSIFWAGLDHRIMNVLNGNTLVNYAIYECADGKWLAVGALEVKFWNNICQLVGKNDWQRSHEIELSIYNFPKQEVTHLFKTRTRNEWVDFFAGQDVCISPVLELEELRVQQQLVARRMFTEFNTESGKKLTTFRLPFTYND